MSNIPKARQLLAEVLDEGCLPLFSRLKIEDALSMMDRKKSKHRRAKRRDPFTAAEAQEVRHLHRITDMSQADLAARFGVNQGRISEAIRGII